jgi:hypothetical protein
MYKLDYEPQFHDSRWQGRTALAVTLVALFVFVLSLVFSFYINVRAMISNEWPIAVFLYVIAFILAVAGGVGSLLAPAHQRLWGATIILLLLTIVALLMRPALNMA